jgi:MFS family permease
VGSAVSFYLPLSVVPLYAKSSGSDAGAGVATGVLLLTTVGCELVTPRLVARIGYRWSLTAGLVLLGPPTLLLLASSSQWAIVAVSLVRGVGFAIAVVTGGALTAALIPAERRGEGLAIAGFVSGVPALTALPLGVWGATHWGFAPVFGLTAGASLLGLLTLPAVPTRTPEQTRGHGVLAGARDARLIRLALVFAASTLAVGVLVTFLPLAVGVASAGAAATALFVHSTSSTAARWAVGRLGDRRGHACLLTPSVILSAVGTAMIAATHVPALVVSGAAVSGLGFGMLQNASLALMYAGAAKSEYGAVSAIWNAAYDAGMGVGAIGIGLLATGTGYSIAFLVTAALALPALLPARRLRRDAPASSDASS